MTCFIQPTTPLQAFSPDDPSYGELIAGGLLCAVWFLREHHALLAGSLLAGVALLVLLLCVRRCVVLDEDTGSLQVRYLLLRLPLYQGRLLPLARFTQLQVHHGLLGTQLYLSSRSHGPLGLGWLQSKDGTLDDAASQRVAALAAQLDLPVAQSRHGLV
ncbi:hypothetical protein SAMN02745857_03029 [Andreprevotia lacus DSM 23236]|uniref:Uncharacterized protein n=1 Tax=Andreprevotia lacus DSM 23236 TaxID=1121001 RepID=A0A1W1XVE2_9NEIS|nr:hypothetical protein [Andreprevotia lacus]SMC27919.1 hypothetical protein SAMN02745857_03029 [Andreprevotia lacus DSM 23236]